LIEANQVQEYEIAGQVGGFVIHERLGQGGSAAVYRATQKSFNRDVALKAVHLLDQNKTFYERFEREAQMIASLEHTSIVPIYSFGIHEGQFAYFAMRLMRGGSLSDLLKTGALPPGAVVEIGTQVGKALGYAHKRGVLHRDIKLSNILLDEQGNAFLADFGLAKLLDMGDTQPKDEIAGSAFYISPEQAKGQRATIQSDIYSLGMVLYHMLVGRPAFDGSAMTICYKHVHEQPTPPHEVNHTVPVGLSEAVMRALEKDPTARYRSAEALVEALNNAVGRKQSTGSFRVISARATRPQIRARRMWLVAAVLLLTITLGALVWSRSQRLVQQVLSGAQAEIGALSLTQSEIDAARAALGGGFIAYLVCDYKALTQLTRAREINGLAAENGIGFRAYDSQNRADLQPDLIEQARAEGARAFILCPVTTHSLDESVAALERESIPVVFPTLIDYPYGLKLAANYEAAGRIMGRMAGQIASEEKGGRGNAVVLTFPGTPSEPLFNEGVETGLRETAPAVSLLGFRSGFQLEDSEASIRELLDSGQTIDLIVAITDRAAFGAIAALEAAGVPSDSVAIVSAGGDMIAQNYIRDGYYLRGTLTVNRTEGSTMLYNGLIKLLAGSPVTEVMYLQPGEMLTRERLTTQ
jgi:ABC-type sugar transport system substrate-binding protein